MSPDSDLSALPSSSRDWYFPSPPFIHAAKSPKYHRRFSTNPRPSPLILRRRCFMSFPPPPLPLPELSTMTDSAGELTFPVGQRSRLETSPVSDDVSRKRSEASTAVTGDKLPSFSRPGFKPRWKMAGLVADHISKLEFRLQTYDSAGSKELISSKFGLEDDLSNKGLK